MNRWTGVLRVSLNSNSSKPPFFKVAVSVLLYPSSETLAVPSVNAIFFNGDRVEGTGNPVIERLSDSRNIAEILVAKMGGGAVNSWVVDASTFSGPFAVYKELVPSVNSRGEPKRYDPDGFPASSSIVGILSRCIEQVNDLILSSKKEAKADSLNLHAPSPASPPRTVILGFSKGGTILNQLATELAHSELNSGGNQIDGQEPLPRSPEYHVCPISKERLLSSIVEFHYVDAGLNCAGAYLTDRAVIKKIANRLLCSNAEVRFVLHGTPRQWSDLGRPWIPREKNIMRQRLEDEARICGEKLHVAERFYFANQPPNLQMHFEIIEHMNIC